MRVLTRRRGAVGHDLYAPLRSVVPWVLVVSSEVQSALSIDRELRRIVPDHLSEIRQRTLYVEPPDDIDPPIALTNSDRDVELPRGTDHQFICSFQRYLGFLRAGGIQACDSVAGPDPEIAIQPHRNPQPAEIGKGHVRGEAGQTAVGREF